MSWQNVSIHWLRGSQAKGFSSCGEEGGAWSQVFLFPLQKNMHSALKSHRREELYITNFS